MTMHHGCTVQCGCMSTCNADLTRPDQTRPDPFFRLTSLPRLLISLPQLQTARASDCESDWTQGHGDEPQSPPAAPAEGDRMSDKTAADRGVRHIAVDCSGGTTTGHMCRRFQWFPEDRLPEFWFCHDHRRTTA